MPNHIGKCWNYLKKIEKNETVPEPHTERAARLLVSLTKIDNSMPDLSLPFKCCQLIFKPQISINLLEMSNVNNISNTLRNNGGFGSTN